MSKPKLNEKCIEDICTAIRIGATYDLACKYAGVTYSSFRVWMLQAEKGQKGPPLALLEAVKKAEGDAACKWLAVIEKAAATEWTAAAWKLERRYPNEYGRRRASGEENIDANATARAIAEALRKISESVADGPDEPVDAP